MRALELALSTQRSWTVKAWRSERPVRRWARALVWMADGLGGRRVLFRVDEDGAPRGVDGARVTLDADAHIRLAHPLALDAAERVAWGEHLAERGLVGPFAQLTRTERPAEGSDEDTLRAFPRRAVSVSRLRRILAEAGWTRGEPDDRVRVGFFCKRFEGALGGSPAVGVILLSPGYDATGRHEGAQTPREAYFATRAPGGLSADSLSRVALGEVAPWAVAEVLHDLARLAHG